MITADDMVLYTVCIDLCMNGETVSKHYALYILGYIIEVYISKQE